VKVLQLRQNLWENSKAHPHTITCLYLLCDINWGQNTSQIITQKGLREVRRKSRSFLRLNDKPSRRQCTVLTQTGPRRLCNENVTAAFEIELYQMRVKILKKPSFKCYFLRLKIFDRIGYMIYDIFINCNWVVTRWQYTFTHKQYIEQHK
jgi:hypothetical protein